jgi:hypothetical protein
LFITYNKYVVMNNDTPVHKDLEDLRSRVLDGKWKYTEETSEGTLTYISACMELTQLLAVSAKLVIAILVIARIVYV